MLLLTLLFAVPVQELPKLAVVAEIVDQPQAGVPLELAAVRGVGFRLTGARYVPFEGEQQRQAALACKDNLACISNALRRYEYRYALLCNVDPSLDAEVATLQLINLSTAQAVGRGLATASPEALPDAVERSVRALLDKQDWSPGAGLTLKVAPESAVVQLDATPIEPGRHHVAPGAHQLQAEAPDFVAQTRPLTLLPGDDVEEQLILQEEPTSSWLWIGLGVGAAAVAGGIALTVALLPRDPEVCVFNPRTERCL